LEDPPKILIYGYGNPGRGDDGLGNAFVEKMEQWVRRNSISRIEFDSNYQLNVEDADTISDKDIVIFVDASIEPIEDFCITRVTASEASIEFTMHAVSPSFVLDLCNKLFTKNPVCYLLHIKGYKWELKEGLSSKATVNLSKTFEFLCGQLSSPVNLFERMEELTEC
jgi:hydrogenase maturation protease